MKMECSEIRQLLSQYIDGILDAQTKGFLDKHLSSCGNCKKELLSLKALVDELGSLKPVPAPSSFLNELNTKIETRKSFTGLIRKIFIPLKIKLPMELATAAIVAVLVFSVVNLVQEETPIVGTQSAKVADVVAEKSEMDLAKPAPIREAEKPVSEIEEKEIEERLLEDKKTVKKKGVSKPIKRDIIDKKKVEEKLSAPTLAFQAAPATGKGTPSSRSVGAGETYAPKSRAFRRAAPMESALGAAFREKEQSDAGLKRENAPMEKDEAGPLVVYSSSELSEIIKLIEAFDGEIVSMAYSESQEKVASLRTQLPTKNSKEFLDKLKRLAVFRSPDSNIVDGERDFFEIVVKFKY